MAAAVFLEFTNGDRYKLKFTHSVIREEVETTGKSITELLNDQFFGWAHLMRAGLRQQQPRITVSDASQIIDRLVSEGMDFKAVGDKLVDALVSAGFVRFETAQKVKAEDDDDPNGERQNPPLS
jgi:hypothetical protein